MKAGRNLDAKVAVRLGWRNLHWKEAGHEQRWDGGRASHMTWPGGWYGDGPDDKCYLDKSYSTDIAAAWELVEKARTFEGRQKHIFLGWLVDPITEITPLTICQAFLEATEE